MPRCYVVERADAAVTELQISPVIVDGFKNGFYQWIQRIFLVVVEAKKIFFGKIFLFSKFGSTYRPVVGKPLVLEVLCLEVGTGHLCGICRNC